MLPRPGAPGKSASDGQAANARGADHFFLARYSERSLLQAVVVLVRELLQLLHVSGREQHTEQEVVAKLPTTNPRRGQELAPRVGGLCEQKEQVEKTARTPQACALRQDAPVANGLAEVRVRNNAPTRIKGDTRVNRHPAEKQSPGIGAGSNDILDVATSAKKPIVKHASLAVATADVDVKAVPADIADANVIDAARGTHSERSCPRRSCRS